MPLQCSSQGLSVNGSSVLLLIKLDKDMEVPQCYEFQERNSLKKHSQRNETVVTKTTKVFFVPIEESEWEL